MNKNILYYPIYVYFFIYSLIYVQFGPKLSGMLLTGSIRETGDTYSQIYNISLYRIDIRGYCGIGT